MSVNKQVVDMYSANVPIYLISSSLGLTDSQVITCIVEYSFLNELVNLDLDKICSEYLKNGFDKAKEKFNLSGSTLSYVLARHPYTEFFVKRGNKYIWPEEIIVNLYVNDYVSTTILAGIFGVSLKGITGVLNRNGVETSRRSKFNLNHNFFEEINDEEKAYWLGFMYADGSVSSSNNVISIKLNSIDHSHLLKFSAALDFEGEVDKISYKTALNQIDKEASRVRFSSRKMKKDLIKLGCVPNKTYNMATVPDLPDELVRHFIRGVVDGDGHISKRPLKSVVLDILGAKVLIDWIDSHTANGKITARQGTHQISWYGKNAREVIDFLYTDANIYLDRKMKVATQ